MPLTLLDWLVRSYPTAKRQTFKRMLEADRLRVNGTRPRSLKQPLADTDTVVVDAKPNPAPEILPFPLVHEDADLLVINKPEGLLTSTVPREPRPTALAAVRQYVKKGQVGLIHRLDRDASGLLVFSKCDSAYQSLKTQFFKHTVQRVYVAIVYGRPERAFGRIESRLLELADGSVVTTRHHAKGQPAITDYETLFTSRRMSALRVTLETGRKHQIRTHLAMQNTPIVNDSVYGKEPARGSLMLAAVELAVDHPRTGKRTQWRIELPRSMQILLDEMKREEASP